MRPFLLSLLVLCAAPARAVDAISVESGFGTNRVNPLRFAAQWDGRHRWYYWDVSAGGWNGRNGTVYDFGVTPVFRLAAPAGSPYAEIAVGAHLLSDLDVGDHTELSTRFQFGDHVAAGFRFGPQRRYDVALKLQHLSNGGLRQPNPGINFVLLRLRLLLR